MRNEFSTVINCMDGRVQIPIIKFMQKKYRTKFIDTITEPGPVKILAEWSDINYIDSIIRRIKISTDKHGSRSIAIAAHFNCAGNPVSRDTQIEELNTSVNNLRSKFEKIEIIGLWINEKWKVEEVIS
jgi:carbonic anhydrase